AIVRTFSTGKTLGDGLNKLETVGLPRHPALKGAWQKMYGWTSDAPAVRHRGNGAAGTDQSLAKYMVVACSAFVSYLIEEANKKELLHNATGHVESGNQAGAGRSPMISTGRLARGILPQPFGIVSHV